MTHPTQDKPTSVTGFSSSFLFFVSLRRVFSFLFCFCFYLFLLVDVEKLGAEWWLTIRQCHTMSFLFVKDDIGNVCGTLRENYGHTTPEKREKKKYFFKFFSKRSDKRAHSHPSFTMCCVVCTLYVYKPTAHSYIFIPPAEISWVPFLAVVVVFTGCAQTDHMRTLLRSTSLLKLLTRQYI